MTLGRDAARRPWRIAGVAALAAALACLGASAPAAAVESDAYSAMIADDDDYRAGKAAIEAGGWEEAIRRLSRAEVRHPENADLHNYLGFAHRKLGRMDAAFMHYKRALALEPRHRAAHEYIGEAYLQVGDVAGARKHVEALRAICLLPCEELADLEAAIVRHGRAAPGAPAAAR
jgi:Flp pilus assembly protein TadD